VRNPKTIKNIFLILLTLVAYSSFFFICLICLNGFYSVKLCIWKQNTKLSFFCQFNFVSSIHLSKIQTAAGLPLNTLYR
jgi:hypothetical protein